MRLSVPIERRSRPELVFLDMSLNSMVFLATIGEHVQAVHIPCNTLPSYGIIAAGRREVYAVSANFHKPHYFVMRLSLELERYIPYQPSPPRPLRLALFPVMVLLLEKIRAMPG